MSKIELDKYYTTPDLAEYVVNKTIEVIGNDNITEFLEPSAGAGAFLPYFKKPYLAYDIKPEADNIIEKDFLKVKLDYKKGRCIIGNPPFGVRGSLYIGFLKKCTKISDYISFILPISQLNNNFHTRKDSNIIYSEDLGIRKYSNIDIHCCFNVYRNSFKNEVSEIKTDKLKQLSIFPVHKSIHRNDKIPNEYDFSICGWGSNTGKLCNRQNQYATQIYFVVDKKYKEKVKRFIESADWGKLYPNVSVKRLACWKIIKYLKEMIPELEYVDDKKSKLGNFI